VAALALPEVRMTPATRPGRVSGSLLERLKMVISPDHIEAARLA